MIRSAEPIPDRDTTSRPGSPGTASAGLRTILKQPWPRRAGHGVAVLLKVYANSIDGQGGGANQRIGDAGADHRRLDVTRRSRAEANAYAEDFNLFHDQTRARNRESLVGGR